MLASFFVLFVAILSTLFLIVTMTAELITSRINPYETGNSDEDKQRGRIKMLAIFIMALFWSAYIIFF